jgi:hypothetical protein
VRLPLTETSHFPLPTCECSICRAGASHRKQPQKYYSMSCRRKDFGSDSVCALSLILPPCITSQACLRRYGLCFNRLDPRFQVSGVVAWAATMPMMGGVTSAFRICSRLALAAGCTFTSCNLRQRRCDLCRGQCSSSLSRGSVTRCCSYIDEDSAESFYCCAWGADCVTGEQRRAVQEPDALKRR